MAEHYTSEQYKYLLIKRLQRHFSMNSAKDRAYTQSFFWKLFDESVTVTEEAYVNFVSRMDDQLEVCAKYNVYEASDLSNIPSDIFNWQQQLMVDVFATIDITLVIEEKGFGGTATFTKPNGEVLTYSNTGFKINCKARTAYQYARASAPAYNMQGMEVPGAAEINPKVSGPDTYWHYDANTSAVTITGRGAYAGAPTEEQLGSGAYTTVIIGAEVSRLLDQCMVDSEKTLVLLHPVDGNISIGSKFNAKVGSCSTTYLSLDVYTDCEAARTVLSGEAFTKYITLHSLSEWEG